MSASVLHYYGKNGYPVYIGRDCLAEILPGLCAGRSKAVILTDTNIEKLWLDKVASLLRCPYVSFVPGEGETIKSAEVLLDTWKFFSEQGLDRNSAVIALGGGTVGDLAGFAAATYMRGIHLIEIPTTLLAMTDSSVGGKNGINTTFSKNTVGTFYRPDTVVCDSSFLDTLPKCQIRSGMGEIIKYSFIKNDVLPGLLDKDDPDIDAVITECLKIKRHAVENDEFDTGERMLLNFGHTIGHAVEKMSDYSLPHGAFVAYGCLCVLNACAKKGLAPENLFDNCGKMIDKLSERIYISYPAEEILELIVSDKKTVNGKIRFICPDSNGKLCVRSFEKEEALEFIRLGIDLQ